MRTLGTLGISVGTSLAFELDGPKIIKTNDALLFNLNTLIRNAIQSIEGEHKYTAKDIHEFVLEDIKLLAKFIESSRGTKPISLVIYKPDYNALKSSYRHADLWEPTTELQLAYRKLLNDTLFLLDNRLGKSIKTVKHTVPSFDGRGLVLTHHPVDLVGTPVGRLKLLESHTGLIKPFNSWHTKLTNGSKLINMPLNKLTIQIFGDRSTNFKSQKQKIKQIVEDMAEKNKWTSSTSEARVRQSINNHNVEIERHYFLKMLG